MRRAYKVQMKGEVFAESIDDALAQLAAYFGDREHDGSSFSALSVIVAPKSLFPKDFGERVDRYASGFRAVITEKPQ